MDGALEMGPLVLSNRLKVHMIAVKRSVHHNSDTIVFFLRDHKINFTN